MEMKSRNNDESMDLVPMNESCPKVVTSERLLSKLPNEIHNHHALQINERTIQNTMDFTKNIKKNKIINRQPPGTMKLSKIKKLIIFGVAWVAVVVGVVIGNFWTPIFNRILRNELVLSPTSQSYLTWKETPIPMYLKIYLFNWTNSIEFMRNHSKPHLNELGPYVFREVDYKVNQVWNDNGTVTFNQKRVWHFEESMSNGALNDLVTNLNPVALSLGYKVRHKGFLALLASSLLKEFKEKLTVTKTVGEILFMGYDDKILEIAHSLNVSAGFPATKFGWFYGRNESETYDGTFNMLTGSKNMFNVGILQEWNYKNKNKVYPGTCSSIAGSMGDLIPPLIHNNSVPIFAPDLCTLIHLKYSNMMEHEGLSGKRFISTAEMFDNGTKVSSRACYCAGVECQPSGSINISTCKYGAPAFMSLPHFYLADESYRNSIDGMKPEKDKHEFSLAVQPDLGMPLQVRGRLQLNLLLQPIHNMEMYENVPKMFMPVLWFSQEANLTSSYASQIKFILIVPLLGHVTLYGIAGIGILVFFIGICLLMRERRKADDIRNLISKTEDNSAVITDE